MPCFNAMSDLIPQQLADAHEDNLKRRVLQLTAELDKVTKFLCQTGQILKQTGGFKLLSEDCQAYLDEHFNFDRIRIQRQIDELQNKINELIKEKKGI